jgi:hypothetical protein
VVLVGIRYPSRKSLPMWGFDLRKSRNSSECQSSHNCHVRSGRSDRRSRKKPRLASGCLFLLVFVVATSLASCVPARSRSEVIGLYELQRKMQKITLDIFPNETFTETITFAPGKVQVLSGKWSWEKVRIGFDGLWIPKSFAPEYVRQADSEAKGSQPKYTEVGNWSLSTERHWGAMTIPVFPDEEIGFTKVRN